MLTILPVRGVDSWGSGAYLAKRGDRKHNGVDLACYPGTLIMSLGEGIVSKIGYPYDPNDPLKGYLRYVQVTDKNNYDLRYFYIEPIVILGDFIIKGQVLGVTQDLQKPYPGITGHVHFEVKKDEKYIDPMNWVR